MTLKLTSPAFAQGGAIPKDCTCEGADVSPPLVWEGVPGGTRSLALVVDDPDAPDPAKPRMVWVHWLLYAIPPDAAGLAKNAGAGAVPEGARFGVNDFKRADYGGPCPPVGRHRYFFRLYALDRVLEGLERPTRAELDAAMRGHVLAEAELMGTYEKGG